MSTTVARPRPGSVLRVTLAQHRRALLWWAIGIALMASMFAAFYPSVRDSGDTFDDYVLEQLPEAFENIIGTDLTSPAGYLWSQLFSSVGPVVFLVYAIGSGSRAIAGEEEAGSLTSCCRRRSAARWSCGTRPWRWWPAPPRCRWSCWS